jgi:hypothetical protein
MRDDLKAAVRSLRSSRSFTAVALVALTLGVGTTTAIFSVERRIASVDPEVAVRAFAVAIVDRD